MKKLTILIIFNLIIQSSFCQSLNLLNSGNIWNNLEETFQAEDCCVFTHSIKFFGDTVLQSVAYKKVLQSEDSTQNHWQTIGFVREDSNKGLYFIYLHGTQEEQLLYNYNLGLNDTIMIPDMLGYKDSSFFVVSNIENVYIDGSIKKKYSLVYPEYNNYKETWIESIGSLQGILWPGRYGAGSIPTLLCCFHDSELIFKNPDYDRCYYSVRPTTGINKFNASSFKIFPNLSDQNITIQFPDSKQRRISIYNSCGTLIEEFVCYESEKIFNISNYQTGLYLIVSAGENYKSQKFMKY